MTPASPPIHTPLATSGGPLPGIGPYSADLVAKLKAAQQSKGLAYRPRTKHLDDSGQAAFTNRLLLQTSPYLLQHAHNPVNWFPWSEEAFALAKQSGRPVFLSVGYSTCHWCHVMEEESFEDLEIAQFLNENFIAIKVDREERPDVDGVYMAAVQAMTQRGGWPMSVWLTADRKPFFGGTYFPPRDGVRGARSGFLTILKSLAQEYQGNFDKIVSSSESLTRAVQENLAAKAPADVDDNAALEQAMALYKDRFDAKEGGLQVRTKFPSQLPIRLLLRRGEATDDPRLIEMARLTLDKMSAGGMYDHVGGGFHRYSTDPQWLVPHFEKMLYDNALLTMAYLEGAQVFDDDAYLRVAKQTLAWVEREMIAPEGGFYSATDADSIGPSGHREEGYFFTWTPAELRAELGLADAELVAKVFNVTDAGNFAEEGRDTGRSILHRRSRLENIAATLKRSPEDLNRALAVHFEKLRVARSERLAPLRDDKVLVAWNGLMISAFAQAAFVTGETHYREVAARAAQFVLDHMRTNEGRLLRTYKSGTAGAKGEAKIDAYLDDYANFIAALLDLFEVTSDVKWLSAALALQAQLDAHYADAQGGYLMTADFAEGLFVREKPDYDGAEPAGNSIAAMNLLRLGEYTTTARFSEQASALFRGFADGLSRQPSAMSEMLLALDFHLEKPREIAIVTPLGGDATAMLAPLRAQFVPRRVLVVTEEGAPLSAIATAVPWLEGKIAQRDLPTAYVCQSYVCRLPVTDVAKFSEQLKAK